MDRKERKKRLERYKRKEKAINSYMLGIFGKIDVFGRKKPHPSMFFEPLIHYSEEEKIQVVSLEEKRQEICRKILHLFSEIDAIFDTCEKYEFEKKYDFMCNCSPAHKIHVFDLSEHKSNK